MPGIGWMRLFYILVFAFGACIFSFLNVVVYRVPRKLSFVNGRSFCPSCNHALGALDLIPVFSYLFLRGRCRYCKTKFGARDTYVELLGGLLAGFCLWYYRWDLKQMLLTFCFYCVLTVVALIDADTMEIPDGCHIAILIIGIVACVCSGNIGLLQRGIGALCISVPMLLLALLIPGAFGGGDIKLMFACGFFLGVKLVLISTVIAILAGGGYGILLLLTKRAKKKDLFAFGPFLCIGMAIGLPYGGQIIDWYLSLLF